MNLLHCDKVEVTEWYDGLVQGFVYHSKNLFYAILLAWNVDLAKKLYLIVPLEANHKALISAAYVDPAKWPEARELIKKIISKRDCYFSKKTPSNNADINLLIAQNLSDANLQLERFTIDQATSERLIEKWLK